MKCAEAACSKYSSRTWISPQLPEHIWQLIGLQWKEAVEFKGWWCTPGRAVKRRGELSRYFQRGLSCRIPQIPPASQRQIWHPRAAVWSTEICSAQLKIVNCTKKKTQKPPQTAASAQPPSSLRPASVQPLSSLCPGWFSHNLSLQCRLFTRWLSKHVATLESTVHFVYFVHLFPVCERFKAKSNKPLQGLDIFLRDKHQVHHIQIWNPPQFADGGLQNVVNSVIGYERCFQGQLESRKPNCLLPLPAHPSVPTRPAFINRRMHSRL